MNASDQQLAVIDASPPSTASVAIMMNPGHMQALLNFADVMASSVLTVPQHLQGKPADCLAIAMQAAQWGMNPFAVAQKTHIVSGRLGYEAQLVNAVVQASGAIAGSFHYEFNGAGQDIECRVGAVLRGEQDVTWGEWLRNGDVKTRNSPLWNVNPKQQLGYLQVKNWARLYAPGAILGVYTVDELPAAPSGGNREMGLVDEVAPPPRGPRRASERAEPPPVDRETGEVAPPAAATASPAATPPAQAASKPAAAPSPGSTGATISAGQVAYLRGKLKNAGMKEADAAARYGVESIEQFNVDAFDELKSELLALN